MAEFTTPKHGEICWRHLSTKDLGKAKEFYTGLAGWTLEQSKLAEPFEYPEIQVDGKAVGGMMQMTEEYGDTPSHWMTYIAVDNADETVEKIKTFGGSVHIPPFDAPSVGRISVVNDPAGATFSIIQFVKE
jgi:predicted enzyme related to lactoylglutathione lyase